MDSYFTIQNIENILYKDKASKFIGFAYSVNSEFEIKEKLELVKQLHPKATHHCYAYRLGLDKNNYRANDDGEPNGTAGKPILGQIDSFSVTNVLVIVVRYFGGTKLGVSGLIDAYKECAKMTFQSTQIIEQKIMNYYEIRCDYTSINKVYQLINNTNATIVEQQVDNQSSFLIALESNKIKDVETKLIDERIEYKFIEKK
ncbi:MAG TPA: YigZ family protein [Chitinophagales bacterium]|nr:YigZ family protein [Chitinophagales bacterium]